MWTKIVLEPYNRINGLVVRSCQTILGRALYLSLLAVVLPSFWLVIIALELKGSNVSRALLPMFSLTLVSCISIASRLYWVRFQAPTEASDRDKAASAKDEADKKIKEHQESHREHRALGNRVIVHGIPFKYGVARRHFERAPWYRN